jgi:uncharacterized RDD family membrane protein YckC
MPPPGGPPPAGGGPVMSPYGPLAEFQDRVLSGVIDFLGPWILGYILSSIGGAFTPFSGDRGGLWFAGYGVQLLAIAWSLYNGYLAGQTGQSIGMKQSNLRCVGETTGQPIGGGQGVVRNLLWVVGGCCCGIIILVDSLFPLWDPKKQTLRDKIGKSVVVKLG